ncbi:MAG: nucleotidyltransferase family protein [Methanomicrobia archaeon]|nr:nucleotidyltransferase family protein [Methanomicrobia archaeon]
MLTSEEIIQKLEENGKKIKEYGVKRIGLFGSYMRNEQRAESDIDILVEFEKGKKTFDNYMNLKFFLEELFGCKVDLVIIEAIKSDLRPYILGSAKYATGV